MREYTADQIPYLRFTSIPANGRVRHAVFTRRGGVSQVPFDTLNLSLSVPDTEENVSANRARAYGSHGRGIRSLAQAHLTHGAGVAMVGHAHHGQYVGPVDGLITDEPGCGLAMNYADCAPIFLYDPRKKAIGLGHAGWKGAISDLPGATFWRPLAQPSAPAATKLASRSYRPSMKLSPKPISSCVLLTARTTSAFSICQPPMQTAWRPPAFSTLSRRDYARLAGRTSSSPIAPKTAAPAASA
jgi:hypothetical protein